MSTDIAQSLGQTFGPTEWRTITQEEIDTFARLSGDHQWIHVDTERAARDSPWGTTIAHGNLTLGLIDGFRDALVGAAPAGAAYGVNYGYDRVRFPAPVPANSRVRGHMTIAEVTDLGGGWWQITQRFTVELAGSDKPACVADSIVRVLQRT